MKLRPRSIAPLYLLASTAFACWAVEAGGVRLNLSPSVPIGLYRLSGSPARPGDLVAVCLPESAGTFGRERGYLKRGSCPGGASPVIKHVAAASGSRVEIQPEGVFVDGRHIQRTGPLVDSNDRTLSPLGPGSFALSLGQLWLISPKQNSWDSRFFGPVDISMVLGKVHPIWTVDSEQPDAHQ